MHAWCDHCKQVRLFYYRFKEAVFCCESCQHCEKFPTKESPLPH